MYLAIREQISYTLSIECIIGGKACKILPFCFRNSAPVLITSCSHEKRYQALPTYTYLRSGVGMPGNETTYDREWFVKIEIR